MQQYFQIAMLPFGQIRFPWFSGQCVGFDTLGKLFYILVQFPVSNQIYLVTLRPRQLTQASFLQKNQTLQNTEMAQSLSSLQKSKSLKLIILIFHVKNLNN